MTRVYHFAAASVVKGEPAWGVRAERGVPLGFSPLLWRDGWGSWLDREGECGLSLWDVRSEFERSGVPLGLFVMRPFGSPLSGRSSYRLDASEEFSKETGRNPEEWMRSLREVWDGDLVCGIGTEPESFTPVDFMRWTSPLWGIDARVSFDAASGKPEDSPLFRCLNVDGVRSRCLIERAPRLSDAHWSGFCVFGLHRGAFDEDRLGLGDWPPGSIVMLEKRDPDRSPKVLASLAVVMLKRYPNLSVALDMTYLTWEQVGRIAEIANHRDTLA